jgi:Protein of Unknown function (DUF2784)
MFKLLLPFLVHVFHVFVVAFVVLVPFVIEIPMFLILHIVSCVSLLVHWESNNNACSLTLLECYLRGIKEDEALSHRFIAPVYDIVTDNEWTGILKAVVVILMLISIYRLYKSPMFGKVQENYEKHRDEISKLGWGERWSRYVAISRPIFMSAKE